MRFALVVVLQLVLSVLLLGALLPAVLYAVPAARGPKAGMATAAALLVLVFVVLRLVGARINASQAGDGPSVP